MEIWDAYDEKFNKIPNVTLIRGKPVPEGMFHLVCDIAVKHTDSEYLLMQREYNKHFGGMWELTAGGSAFQGETPIECAIRELKEETGIDCEKLQKLGVVVDKNHRSYYFEYLCITEIDKNAITLQTDETIAYKWVTADYIKNLKATQFATTRIQKFIEELQV